MTSHSRPFLSNPLPLPWLLSALLTCVLGGAATGHAGEPPPDKSSLHLFHFTPNTLMRERRADRPHETELHSTVDATFDPNKSDGGDVGAQVWGLTSLHLKLGLLKNVGIQFVLDTSVDSRAEGRVANTLEKASGFGDWQTRLKINLRGHDARRRAFAAMPFVKWLLSQSSLRSGATEGGAIFIAGYELPAGWGLAVMTEFDFVSIGSVGYDAESFNTISFSHDIVG